MHMISVDVSDELAGPGQPGVHHQNRVSNQISLLLGFSKLIGSRALQIGTIELWLVEAAGRPCNAHDAGHAAKARSQL